VQEIVIQSPIFKQVAKIKKLLLQKRIVQHLTGFFPFLTE